MGLARRLLKLGNESRFKGFHGISTASKDVLGPFKSFEVFDLSLRERSNVDIAFWQDQGFERHEI